MGVMNTPDRTMKVTDTNGKEYEFSHRHYSVGCGGTESPILWGGKAYLYVWNIINHVHEYYVYGEDVFIKDNEAPWLQEVGA